MTIARIRADLAARRVSVEELAALVLRRIERFDSAINAYVHVDRDGVLRQARELQRAFDAGAARGSLFGIPIGVKDLVDVAGTPTRAGSSFYRKDPQEDAPLVRGLRSAGALIVGKLNMHEFAWGMTTENPHFGRTANPWNLDRIAGGSSGGSGAAVAAGLAAGAVGTDTNGSIRAPAACCGVSGLRPGWGSVASEGVFPLARSFDVAGPLAHGVDDVEIMLSAMRGDGDCARAPRPSLRVARLRGGFWEEVQPDVGTALDRAEAAFREAGVEIGELVWCDAQMVDALLTLSGKEAAGVHAEWFAAHPERYGADVRERIRFASALTEAQVCEAMAVRARARWTFDCAVAGFDALLAPAIPFPPPPAGSTVVIGGRELQPRAAMIPFMAPASLFRLPALAIPCGFTDDGLPLALQLIGTSPNESGVLEAGRAFQRVTDHHRRTPDLFLM